MNLYTPVQIPGKLPRLSQADSLMLLGSCFATEMGQRLCDAKFPCDVNPYGVLYNPLSIAAALREVVQGKRYTEADLFLHRGYWHSPMHHGDFSSPDSKYTLETINRRVEEAHSRIFCLDALLITWGTAYVYEEKDSGRIVGNCHKLPERCFNRRRLSADEIVADYAALLSGLLARNPKMKLILTVSPIRHIRDGLHENQLSKAVLLLAAEQLQLLFPEQVHYFPAYEILLDELRDYRFYAEDLVHPSKVAADYVWQRFVEACLTEQARLIMEEYSHIRKALEHKPFRPEAEEYKTFLGQIVLKIEQLSTKFPYLDFQNEMEICRTRLNK